MNKVNHRQMYLALKQQEKALRDQLNPEIAVETTNEIPTDFNQKGWDLTVEKLELLVSKMKSLQGVKGKRLTPQFYRSIYNRALIGANEVDKLHESIVSQDQDIDYEAESFKLIKIVNDLNTELFVKQTDAKKAEEAEKEKKPEQPKQEK